MNGIRDAFNDPTCRPALTRVGRLTIEVGASYLGAVLIRAGGLPIIPTFLFSAELALLVSKRHAYSAGVAVCGLGVSLYHEYSALALTILNPAPQPPHIVNFPANLLIQLQPALILQNNDAQISSREP